MVFIQYETLINCFLREMDFSPQHEKMHYLYMFTKLIMLYGTGIVPLPSTHYLLTISVAEITMCVDGIPVPKSRLPSGYLT